MALPELLFPSTLPLFMAAAHVQTPEGLYVQAERMTGGSRRRRVFLTAPRILEASVELTQEQVHDFYAWHEGPLRAGEVPFTAPVAKLGAGLEYWSAICLSFKLEHQEGSHHKLSLRLRLKGTPEASPPVVTSMYAEVTAALGFSANAEYLNQLYAEAGALLEVLVENGAAMEAEVRFRMYTEFDGPSTTHTPLDAEVHIPLESVGAIEGSAAFEAEVLAGLLTLFVQDILFAAEVSAGLLTSVALTGPNNPGAITGTDLTTSPYAVNCSIALQVWTDGKLYVRDSAGGLTYKGNWYLPSTASVGDGYWVKIVHAQGVLDGGYAENASGYRWLAGMVSWILTNTDAGTSLADTATVYIATDPDGLNVAFSFTCALTANYNI